MNPAHHLRSSPEVRHKLLVHLRSDLPKTREYAAMARRRIERDAPLLADVVGGAS